VIAIGRTLQKDGSLSGEKGESAYRACQVACPRISDPARSSNHHIPCLAPAGIVFEVLRRRLRLSNQLDSAGARAYQSNARSGGEGYDSLSFDSDCCQRLAQARIGSMDKLLVKATIDVNADSLHLRGRLRCCAACKWRQSPRAPCNVREAKVSMRRRYAPPSPNFQIGIPIRFALSARLS
jgi:hypothetical protein